MSQIQEVKEATDIVQLLGERLQLQHSGSSWRALCPFHSEKSPSFFVNEQFQRYKCFGCGESGDVFTFLEKYEGMTFAEALRYLADRAGIKLESFAVTPEDTLREQILAVLDLTKEYYHYLLTKHTSGEPARAYLKDRGVTQESVRLFQLGYALPGWDGLVKYLHGKKKYDLQLLEQAGLIIRGRTGKAYDRFRGRLMFPLRNHRGQVVGFSGRLLDQKQKEEAKYINTPETLVYHKGQMLFGFSELYQELRKKKEAIVVEGEFDVISSTQAHVNNVVGIKGSALTLDHLKLLKRVADVVLLSLDMDAAGRTATKRAISLASQQNLELRVIKIAGQKDPDELARTEPQLWRQAVKGSVSVYTFFLETALAEHDPATPEGKRKIMTELAPILANIPLVVEQDVYIKKLATALNVKEELVRTDLERLKNVGAASVTPQISQPAKPVKVEPLTRRTRLERYVMFLLLHSDGQPFIERLKQLKPEWLSSPHYRQVIKALVEQTLTFKLSQFARSLPDDQQRLVFDLYADAEFMVELEELDLAKEWKQSVADLKAAQIKDRVTEVEQALADLDKIETKSPEQEHEQTRLLQELTRLQKQRTPT